MSKASNSFFLAFLCFCCYNMSLVMGMEEKNRINLSEDDFKKAYKESLLANEDLSYVVRQLIENDCIDLRESPTYFRVEDAVRAFDFLDEFLKYNVEDLESYELTSNIYLDATQYYVKGEPRNTYLYCSHPIIQICQFASCFGKSKYNMYTDGYPGELHYLLKNGIRVEDAVKTEGVLSILVKPTGINGISTLQIEKDYVNNGLFIEETYNDSFSCPSIDFMIYDLNKALARGEKHPFTGIEAKDIEIMPFPYKRDKNGVMGGRKPWFLTQRDIAACGVIMYDVDKNEYHLHYRENGNTHDGKLTGESLYSVYYNFMEENKYFSPNQRKYERNRK